jgi:hypothetical protein
VGVQRLTALLLVALVVLSSGTAAATSIGVLRPSTSSPAIEEAMFRVQGELLALSLEVHVMVRPEKADLAGVEPSSWLERTAAERRIDAVVELIGDETPTAVDVWIFGKGTPDPRVTRVALEPGTPNTAETLAIRAIEVLRSNFVEIDLAAKYPGRAPPPPVAPEPSAPEAPAPHPVLGFQAGAAVLTSLQGVGPALLPLVRLDLALGGPLVVEATLAGLGTRPSIESDAGSARVSQGYGMLGLCYCSPHRAGFGPLLSISVGALHTSLDGEADAPERAHHVQQWSFLAEGAAGARLDFADRYYLTLTGHVQLAEPYVAVHFVDELVASSGRPNLLASLTVGAWL